MLTPEEAKLAIARILAQVEIKKVYWGAQEGATMYFEFVEDYRESRHSIFKPAEYLLVAVRRSDLEQLRKAVNHGEEALCGMPRRERPE